MTLREPETTARQQSYHLTELIKQEILASHGAITFARFMALALYAPELGYYSGTNEIFGKKGDFITAPELSSDFANALAVPCQSVLNTMDNGAILEFGGGSGALAAELLLALAERDALPEKYFMLDISPALQKRQRERIALLPEALQRRVQWLDELPSTPMRGVILANEVLDAMPSHRFAYRKSEILEQCITLVDQTLHLTEKKALNSLLSSAVRELLPLSDNFVSEINLTLASWLQQISASLSDGMMLIIDYGFPRQEFYHPTRSTGTLRCYYQHHVHSDPLFFPGLQDITTHVDFSAVASAAVRAGFEVAGYTTQALFLLDCGLINLSAGQNNEIDRYRQAQAIKMLTLPTEMGELFKCMALTKRLTVEPVGFRLRDLRDRL